MQQLLAKSACSIGSKYAAAAAAAADACAAAACAAAACAAAACFFCFFREGRCSLATSLAAYKFMVLYGVLLSVAKMLLLVAAGGSCMSQALYLTIDVGVLLGVSNLMMLAR